MRRRCEQYGLWSSFAAFPEKEGGIQLLSAATKFSETFRVRKNTDVVSLSPSLSHILSPFHELLDSSQFDQDMESDPAETSVSSRWNPTKEQITMLESLYRQGIRTPSAEQIQHITSRLRAYGHIKGKNVFYWFQNHKARQRQKQKQESMAHIDRFFHRAQPIFPLCKNVTCGPYFLPQSDIGFYPQYCHPKVLLTGGIRRRPRTEKVEKSRAVENAGRNTTHQEYHTHTGNSASEPATIDSKKTLPLFPLHPTGIVQGKTGKPLTGSPAWNSPNPGLSEVEEASGDQRLFDFFSGRGFCEIG